MIAARTRRQRWWERPARTDALLAALALLFVPIQTHAQLAGLDRFQSGRYQVFTDMPRDEAREFASYMNMMFDEYRRRFSGFNTRNATQARLYLFDDRASYLRNLAELGIDATNSGGMFFWNPEGTGLASFANDQPRERLLHTLRHEGFHQFAHRHLGETLPIWANEGLAEYFGHALVINNRVRTGVFSFSDLDRVKQALERDAYLPFEDLLTMSGREWNFRLRSGDPRASLGYLQSWSVVHFLIHADRGKYQRAFQKYLELVSQGRDSLDAAEIAFGTREFDAFERRWKKYVLEEQEPDALSTATDRLSYLAHGLRVLHADDAPEATDPPSTTDQPTRDRPAIDSVESLRKALVDIGFELRRVRASGEQDVFPAAEHPEMFEAPSERRGRRERQGTIELIPSEDDATPPTVRITGLSVPLQIQWVTREAGGLGWRIVYR